MAKKELIVPRSYTKLKRVVGSRFPHLTNTEVSKLTDIVLAETSECIKVGDRLARVSTDSNGKTRLTIINLNVREKGG